MGLSGRKPTPATLIDPIEHKKSKEDLNARIEIEESLKASSKLSCPKYLSDQAKKEWRRVVRLYRSLESDLLCDLDISALAIYCEAWAIYRKAQETWAKYTQVVAANPEAQRVLDKCFLIMEKQSRIINNISEQLCLTPVGRARMGMMASKKDSQISEVEKMFLDDD